MPTLGTPLLLRIALIPPRYGSILPLIAAGCATATANEGPGVEDPNGSVPALGAGGTGTDSSGVGGAPSAGESAGGRAAGMAGRASRGGSPNGGGPALMGGAGTLSGVAGTTSSVACDDPRMPATPGAMNGNSGSFDTAGAVCYFVEGTFNSWNCSNLGGRTVTVNGVPTMCGGALPAPVDGGYYFEFGASSSGTQYTSFYWYTS